MSEKTWENNDIDIPDNFRKLNYGEPMKKDDLVWTFVQDPVTLKWKEDWVLFGECDDVDYPYNTSYRPIVRENEYDPFYCYDHECSKKSCGCPEIETKECQFCFEQMDTECFVIDPEMGECCVECSIYFQQERDEFDDNMRKLEKESWIDELP